MQHHLLLCRGFLLGAALLATASEGAELGAELPLPDLSAYAQRAPVYDTSRTVATAESQAPALPSGVVRANTQSPSTHPVTLATHETVTTPDPPVESTSETGRRLQLSRSPRSDTTPSSPGAGERTDQLLSGLSEHSVTAIGATALVVGLFLVCAWAMKRSMPRSQRILPREVVEVLGRTPLGPRQFAHLLHVGNKIVLVSMSPAGMETLVEVSDPQEVDRMLGLCKTGDSASSTKEFEAIFQQFAKEPTTKGFLGDDAPAFGSAASTAYAQHSRSTRHA